MKKCGITVEERNEYLKKMREADAKQDPQILVDLEIEYVGKMSGKPPEEVKTMDLTEFAPYIEKLRKGVSMVDIQDFLKACGASAA